MAILHYLYLLSAFLFSFSETSPPWEPMERDSLVSRFFASQRGYFQEKVYLHTDKEHYLGGETIWFRAYRVDATTHIPDRLSRFVYIELYDDKNKLVERLKVMEQQGIFQGALKLDPYLSSGKYFLRAYTYWMQNADESFYFFKPIYVTHSLHPQLKSSIRWHNLREENASVSFRLQDVGGDCFPKSFVEAWLYRDGKNKRQLTRRSDSLGWAYFPLLPNDSISHIRFHFQDKKPLEYAINSIVPVRHYRMDIQFLPEGGKLLAGVKNQVNFKAVRNDGLGCPVFGCIYDSQEQPIAVFSSSHLGMGRLEFTPQADESYHALCTSDHGEEIRVELPAVKQRGCGLHVWSDTTALHCHCLSTPGLEIESPLYLLVHSRGKLLSLERVFPDWKGSLQLKSLPAGIIHFSLVDGKGIMYGERLSFVYPSPKEQIEVEMTRSPVGPRDSICFSLHYSGADSLSCSVVVTDSVLTTHTPYRSNMLNYFLLDSDLKGKVEAPGWYFDTSIPFRHRARQLDILLSCQGWSRFDVKEWVKGEKSISPFFLELSQGISGEIRNFWGKQAKNSKLYVIAPSLNLLREVEVDSNSHFHINVKFPEHTTFVFQALTSRNSKWVELSFDRDSLRPPLKPLILPPIWREEKLDKDENTDSDFRADEETPQYRSYRYVNGEKIYLLEEAIVRRKQNTLLEQYENIAEEILETRDLKERDFQNLETWITTLPEVDIESINGRRRIYYGNIKYLYATAELRGEDVGVDVRVHVNDFDLTAACNRFELDIVSQLNRIPIDSVLRVGFTKESGMDGRIGDTATVDVFVYIKGEYHFRIPSNRADFVKIVPLGYHQVKKFYQPKYEVETERENPEPDERQTLYWSPDIRLKQGKEEKVFFYRSDTPGPYRLILEGITPRGKIVYFEKILYLQ